MLLVIYKNNLVPFSMIMVSPHRLQCFQGLLMLVQVILATPHGSNLIVFYLYPLTS